MNPSLLRENFGNNFHHRMCDGKGDKRNNRLMPTFKTVYMVEERGRDDAKEGLNHCAEFTLGDLPVALVQTQVWAVLIQQKPRRDHWHLEENFLARVKGKGREGTFQKDLSAWRVIAEEKQVIC